MADPTTDKEITYSTAENLYYTQLKIAKKDDNYKDTAPNDNLKKAVRQWVNSCKTVKQADDVYYTAVKHQYHIDEAAAKLSDLQQAKDAKWEKSSANPKNIIKSIFG